ncbi:MAG: DUF3037 domain-containing protein [Chitinophagaceae bacterium]|nr:MAG: DUF3037 domain-containing protein [Chitinophagaceae bacterium]
MPEQQLFEYAVIRFVPRVEREEFINIGVILYCKSARFLDTRFSVDRRRIESFCAGIDCDELEKHIASFKGITIGAKDAGPIGKLEPALRFRWLTAWRSTIVQSSRVHPGLTSDPAATLDKLLAQLVG